MLVQFRIHRLVSVLVVLIVLLTLSHIASHAYFIVDENRLSELLVEKFSFDNEGNFPTYFSAILLFLSSMLFFLIGWATKQGAEARTYRYWLGLGLIFLFLSTDEAAHIHEHFDTELIWGAYKTTGLLAWPWVIVYGTLVSLFVLRYFNFWWSMPQPFKKSFFLAGFIYVGSALGFEMVEALEYTSNNHSYTFTYLVFSSIEEFCEMSAIAFLIYTNMRYLARMYPSVAFSFKQHGNLANQPGNAALQDDQTSYVPYEPSQLHR